MKTFKQLMEELPKPVTPKQIDVVKSDTRFIRTPDVIKKENQKFRKIVDMGGQHVSKLAAKSDQRSTTS